MQIQCGTNPDGSPNFINVDSSGGQPDEGVILKWKAQRVITSIMDVQDACAAGRNSTPFNINGTPHQPGM